MNLKHIQTDHCPDCGCNTVVKEEVDVLPDNEEWKHSVTGEQWETRTFLCGYSVRYDAGCQSEGSNNICKKNPTYIEMIRKRKVALEQLKKFIYLLDVDPAFMKHLKDSLL